MILYDDKQNFLGMSSHTLSFLGYEDIGDFLSLQNDFANLFTIKEGYIYKFDNFSWIDFVLYSGSANKSAIITLKNGQETKVDLSIKEVHLAHPLNGINKLYSVKIISDNFHKISGVPKNSEGIDGFNLNTLAKDELSVKETANKEIGGFSLNTLVSDELSIPKTTKTEAPKDDFLNLIEEPKQDDNKKSESFILNIAKDESSYKDKEETEPENLEIKTTSTATEDFKLDFTRVDIPLSSEEEQPSDTILHIPETKTEENKENSISDFLLQDEPDNTVEIKKEENFQENQQPTTETFGFNLLKDVDSMENNNEVAVIEKEEESQSEILNLLKVEEPQADEANLGFISNQDESKSEEIEEVNEGGFKLDFLKIDNEKKEEEKEEPTEELVSSDAFEIRQKSEQIIQQIKDDIKEIDAEYKKINSTSSESEDETFSLDIKEPETEQPLNIVSDETVEEYKEDISNYQIQESKTVDTNRSFTNTLKGLFGTTNNKTLKPITESEIEPKTKDDAFAFSLKNSHDDEKAETNRDNEEELHIFDDHTKEEETATVQDTTQEFKLSSLSSLGLDPDDEFDLLSDFISDAKDSIETIEQFIQTNDFDKINYALVKIKSSAEILKLDAIIENSNSMRKHCITEDSEKVTEDTQKLKENIELLEKHLEATAI